MGKAFISVIGVLAHKRFLWIIGATMVFTDMGIRMKTEEEYQEAIKLNPVQARAFAALKKAFKSCRKANIYFYQNMQTLGALNGNNVKRVDEGGDIDAPNCLQFKDYPTIQSEHAFADDTHYITLHDE